MALPRVFMWRIVMVTGVGLVLGAGVITWEWFRGVPPAEEVSLRVALLRGESIRAAADALRAFVPLAPPVAPAQLGNTTPFAVPEHPSERR
ncbi:hypothetical protein HY632_02965 [Candidatus Uhrbacteria bacterium]|nr:hypothetical protein [Candidatus Uhrbacteria bacterium]